MADIYPFPFIPIGRINFASVTPCAPSPWVWLEAADLTGVHLAFSLLAPVWKQEVEWSTGGSWIHNLREVGEDLEIEEPLLVDGLLGVLFEMAALADTLVFWLFVFALIYEFLIEWSSLAWQMSGCIPKPKHFIGASRSPGGLLPNDKTQWFDGPAFFNVGPDLGPNATELIVPEGWIGSVSAAIQWTDVDGNIQDVSTRCINATTGEVLMQRDMDLENFDPVKSATMVRSKNITGAPGGTVIKWQSKYRTGGPLIGAFPGTCRLIMNLESF